MVNFQDVMQGGFNTDSIPDQPPRESLPPMPPGIPGDCMITPAPILVPTKLGTGYFVKVVMQVLNGPHAGRKVVDRINVRNTNPKAEQIAGWHMKELCLAAGIKHLTDLNQLNGKIVRPNLKVDGQYNSVKGYEASPMAAQVAGYVPPPQPAAPAQPAYSPPPQYTPPQPAQYAPPAAPPAAPVNPMAPPQPTYTPPAPPAYQPPSGQTAGPWTGSPNAPTA